MALFEGSLVALNRLSIWGCCFAQQIKNRVSPTSAGYAPAGSFDSRGKADDGSYQDSIRTRGEGVFRLSQLLATKATMELHRMSHISWWRA